MTNMDRLEAIVNRLPEAVRVDVEAWGDHPTFRVRGKNFVFSSHNASVITVKLTREEAAAVVETDEAVTPTRYGLGRAGWVDVHLAPRTGERRWRELEEWVRSRDTERSIQCVSRT